MDRPNRWGLLFQRIGGAPRGSPAKGDEDEQFAATELVGLRAEVLWFITWLLFIPAVVLFASLQYMPNPPEAPLWVGSLSLVAIALLTLYMLGHGIRLAGPFLVGSLTALCIGQAALFASATPLFALPLVALIAGVALGPAAGVASAGASAVVAFVVPTLGDAAYTQRDTLAPILFIGLAAALAWLGTRPLQITLDWSWNSYSRQAGLTEDLRDQQTRLAESMRKLESAYHALERMNAELAHARAAAEEARRLKGEFAAHISHEFRTPLNLVIGFSEMMLDPSQRPDSEVLPPGYRPDVEVIHRNARHLSALIDDVLELGEVEAGHLGLRKDWGDLREIVEEASEVVATLYEEKRLIIDNAVPDDLPTLYVDRTRMRQVFINLLSNAVRFTTKGGVRIDARLGGDDVVVTVTDTGSGISQADLAHVFEEFRQFDSARERQVRGTGLGLAICRRFVELHGGSIWAESTLGEGTRFHFTLPVATQGASLTDLGSWQSNGRARVEPWASSSPTGDLDSSVDEPLVVLVCPDPGPARLFQRHLDGYRVVAAPDLDAASDAPPSRAVIRILGQSDALDEAFGDAAKVGSHTPLLICRLPSERDLREELGVVDYVPKPFTSERLLAALDRVPTPVQSVLVVDDSPEMAELVARTLLASGRGYQVRKAPGGEFALEILRDPTEQIDCVLLDLVMPTTDGSEVLEAIRADPRLERLPVIVVSARGFIDRGVDSSVLALTRGDRFSVRELMACADGVLRALGPK